ncbi:P-loop containing nucleoside triphosphate hydrolase protein, partial [Leptodontidium sp. 2 PMI_412]
LGKPGSGCTTLLKTLAGMTESFHGWSGIIKYFGISVNDIKKRFRGDVVYNAEGDVHFPYLTVLNTLGFAVETKTPGSGMKQDQRHGKVRDLRDSLLKVFGMEETRSTLVGNEFVAGVSGGERKRVSLAEVLSTNAKVSLWDNSTQGLDASTSIRFGKSLQVYTKSGKNIAIAALYQASDDLLRLFDKVTLLSEGQQIFFGTITDAQDHLMSLGFIWPERQSMSEFFIAVTDRDLRVTKEGWEDRVPRSVGDFVKCWKDSIYYQRLQEDLRNDLEQTDRDGTPVHHLASHGQGSSYILSWPAQL